MPSSTDEFALASLDINDVFIHPDTGEEAILMDCKQVGEYSNSVWAYGDPETGAFQGLIEDGGMPIGDSVEVTFVRHAGAGTTQTSAEA